MTQSKNHHWWPRCLSEWWTDSEGRITRVTPDGKTLRLTPKNLAVIGHGHTIKLGRRPGETTVWDYNFENEFQRADGNFPQAIEWLEGLRREERPAAILRERFLSQEASEAALADLIESLVSLAVRNPMTRNAAARPAEHFRGNLPERERNALITLNIRHQQRKLVDGIGARGKFAALYSPHREFVFGDGFFHNLTSPAALPLSPKMLVPLTPRIGVLFACPLQYSTEPRLSTFVLTAEEADVLNRTIQIYAKEMLFYRSERPTLTDEFRRGEHLCYDGPSNPIEELIHSLPGVPSRDASLDFLLAWRGRTG